MITAETCIAVRKRSHVAALSRADHVPVSAILNSFAYDLVATAGIAMLPLRRFWHRKRAAERWE